MGPWGNMHRSVVEHLAPLTSRGTCIWLVAFIGGCVSMSIIEKELESSDWSFGHLFSS